MRKKSLLINIDERFEESISIASELFLKGSIFIYPTDTIYGFGGNPFNEMAIKKSVRLKEKLIGGDIFFLFLISKY